MSTAERITICTLIEYNIALINSKASGDFSWISLWLLAESTLQYRQQTVYLKPPNCSITCLPPPVHMMQRSHDVFMSTTWISKSEWEKHSLTDLAIKMHPAWHDFRVERCYSLSENVFYGIRMCTLRFDLPKDISFMKIKAVSLNQSHGRTQSIERQPNLLALSWGEINKRVLFICAFPCGFSTPTLAPSWIKM